MLVWLIRGFTHDLVEHVAHCRAPETFVPLAVATKRNLGIGNATGLGMAPFLVSHPILINNWVVARETALARVCRLDTASPEQALRTVGLLQRAARHVGQWLVDDKRQMQRIDMLRTEIAKLTNQIDEAIWQGDKPWARLVSLSSHYSIECQELIVALLLEVHPDLSQDLEAGMASAQEPKLDAKMRVSDLADLVTRAFAFALSIDFSKRHEVAQFWYVSEEKLEPRLGDRYHEDGAEREMPLDIARRVQALKRDLDRAEGHETVAEFVLRHPEHRYVAVRVQTSSQYPYSEIRDNLIAETCLPIDMLRFKLAFFGAAKFDPRSDRWTRIAMYQGAPLFDEISEENADDWWLPVLEASV